MAEVTDPKKRSLELPWATLVAVAFATGGFFLYLNPLETSRPAEQGGLRSNVGRPEDVDARLWQDPLRAAAEHDVDVQWKYGPAEKELEVNRHSPRVLFKGHDGDSPPWIVAVMIPGNAYAEYTEERLRIRQAVIEGLGATDYAPDDGEHIGYVKIENGENPNWGWHNMIVPFESYHRDPFFDSAPDRSLPRNVCILWLRDEEFRDGQPLHRLDSLLYQSLAVPATKISIIGPYSSTTLREMAKEAVTLKTSDHLLENVDMWCATATAADEWLLQEVSGAQGFTEIEALFRNKQPKSFHFRRSTLTDTEVIKALIDELQTSRYVHLSPISSKRAWYRIVDLASSRSGRGSKGDRGRDKIAVISELDTFFGRALPMSVREAVLDESSRSRLFDPMWTGNILTFRYLRGIDGMLPGSGGSSDTKSKLADQSKSAVASESTEGLNQSDYLRRLAAELTRRDREFHHKYKNGIKAVGVLGSDIYDKLMILEALGRSLPDAVFFTNNLDARFAHPKEWRWTRNLIVASPFGLTLKDKYQKVPPFRDSIQTAMYTATLLAANYKNIGQTFEKARLGPVRLYEIGRTGAFDLTKNVPAKSLQPVSSDLRRWWNWNRFGWAVLIIVMVGAAAAWILRAIIGPPAKNKNASNKPNSRQPVWRSVWLMFLFFALLSAVLVWVISCWPSNCEPYSWVDGISVWPTETLRLLIFFLSCFYIIRTSRVVLENEMELENHFGFKHCHKKVDGTDLKQNWRNQLKQIFSMTLCRRLWKQVRSRAWWKELFRQMTPHEWKYEVDDDSSTDKLALASKLVSADKLWSCYANSGQKRVRWARIAPLVILYVFAGLFLVLLLGWPPTPARGSWAREWNIVFFVISVVSSMVLTFYVADVTLLNRRLIHCLTNSLTDWPNQAIQGLRDRWTLTDEATQDIPAKRLLAYYLNIDLIARRTEVVSGLIYYPFITMSLFILSRASLFDYWTWPLPILILVGFNVTYAALSAVYLRRTAEQGRQRLLQRLDDLLIAYVAGGKKQEAQTTRETLNIIRAENRGAFAAISQHPLLGALLLPSGSAGIWVLLQYFPRLLPS